MAGYSGTPLPRKLGIKAGHLVVLRHAPAEFVDGTLGALPDGVLLGDALDAVGADVVLLFAKEAEVFERELPALMQRMSVDAGLWLAWPKKASKVPTDITFDIAQGIGLAAGLVDNKVCAIDAVWTGLRLCYRKEDRKRVAAEHSGSV